jgi:hypothetical protein
MRRGDAVRRAGIELLSVEGGVAQLGKCRSQSLRHPVGLFLLKNLTFAQRFIVPNGFGRHKLLYLWMECGLHLG